MNHQIKKDSATIQKEIVTNIMKMLADRNWILSSNIDKLSSFILQKRNQYSRVSFLFEILRQKFI